MRYDKQVLKISASYDAPISVLLNTIAGQHKARVVTFGLCADETLLELSKRRQSDFAQRAAQLTEKVMPQRMADGLGLIPKRAYELSIHVKPGHMDLLGWLLDEKTVFSIQLLVGPVLHTLGECVVTAHNESTNNVTFQARTYMLQDIVWSTVPLEPATKA